MKQIAVLFLLVAVLGGCGVYKPLQIEPVGKKTSVVVPQFAAAYYYFDRDQNLHVVMRSQAVDEKDQSYDQIFTARIFWRPVGGRTSLNPASTSMTYRYIRILPESVGGVGVYEGAGFARITGKNGSREIKVNLVDGELRLTEVSGSFADTLGRARVRGNFTAQYDDAKAVEMLKEAQQEVFARSLPGKPKEEAEKNSNDVPPDNER